MRGRRYGKYNARKTEYNGVVYDSGREARHAVDLDLLAKAGEIRKIERQVPFQFELYGQPICRYIPDFRITHKDGTIEYQDVKGHQTRDFRIKWKMFTAYIAVHEPAARATIVK